MPLQSHGHPDARGPRVGDPLPQLHDSVDGEVADLGNARRRIVQDALTERVPTEGAAIDEVVILRALAQHDVEETEGQRGVSAGDEGQVAVREIGSARAGRVDHHQVGAVPAGRRDGAPQVMVGGQRVAAPEDDELREAESLGIHAHAVVAERVAGAHPARDRADRHEVAGGTDDVPEPTPRTVDALEESHAA